MAEMGRPRIHNREQIALDMIEWAMKDDSINLCKFCCTRQPPLAPSKITEWAREDNNFRLAYEAAKAAIGARREELLTENRLHVKAYDLNAKTYDHFLKDEHRQNLEYESSLKKNENKEQNEALLAAHEKYHQDLKSVQSSYRNIAETKSIKE